MLELNMDMEADLGIDSIKRVEIFGALTKMHPAMSSINPAELTELRTLAEIVSFVSSSTGENTTSNTTTSSVPAAAAAAAAAAVAPIGAAIVPPAQQGVSTNGSGANDGPVNSGIVRSGK